MLAMHLRDFDQRLAEATGRPDPTAKSRLRKPETVTRSVPTPDDIDVAVRHWRMARYRAQDAVDFHRDDPEIGQRLAGEAGYEVLLSESTAPGGGGRPHLFQTQWIAEHLVNRHGWDLEQHGDLFRRLLNRVARGERDLIRQAKAAIAENLPAVDPFFNDEKYKSDAAANAPPKGLPPVSITGLLDGYLAEANCKPATAKAWRACIGDLITHLGHDEAARVRPLDIVQWKERLATPDETGFVRKGRTIRDKYLAASKAVFRWAKSNHKLAVDPTNGITIRVSKPKRLRSAGLTDDEACLILSQSLRDGADAEQNLQAFARRWIPWLCAYTGARVGEIAQLRSQDVAKVEGIWCIRITPEAGTQKTDWAWHVPLHPHLVEQGFLEAVEKRRGPLFYDPANYRGGSKGNPQSKKVAERIAVWVRASGVDDPGVQPNHGWRHRFKTQARLAGMDIEARDATQGHSTGSEASRYGDIPIRLLDKAMRRLPAYLINADSLNVTMPPVDLN